MLCAAFCFFRLRRNHVGTKIFLLTRSSFFRLRLLRRVFAVTNHDHYSFSSIRCTVVLFNSKKLSQTYLLNTSRKAITAVAYSQCGRYLATGECGINPTIKVWELDLSPGNESNCAGSVIAEFSGHKYAVNCVVS